MSSVRRPLLTATAAGALLCGLWFVPTANATGENDAPGGSQKLNSSTTARDTAARDTTAAANRSADRGAPGAAEERTTDAAPASELRLAETGGVDTTPYVVGGTAFLTVGAGFVALSARQQRRAF
ncbi:LAETG motif-containing sortase-dependent surface protein [Streptomyces sp. NPDC060194]|uniref:LAETG motif-containing sortase-dependent surface protein n=1 Tax=Streptomyces sp. NPDC060194 TaxID=3347069 RepID=UPI00364F33D9